MEATPAFQSLGETMVNTGEMTFRNRVDGEEVAAAAAVGGAAGGVGKIRFREEGDEGHGEEGDEGEVKIENAEVGESGPNRGDPLNCSP